MDDMSPLWALLRLQIEWGADEALDEAPVDRLHSAPPATRSGAPTTPAPARPAAPGVVTPEAAASAPRGSAAERALAAAAAAGSLDALRQAIAGFDGCALRDTATRPVLPAGDAGTGLLLIGDPPGADEDRSGEPFAGPGGAMLDRILGSVGLARAQFLAAPLIPWRPPGGRPPSAAEVAICLPFLNRLIALAEPRRIILCGPLTIRTLLGGRRKPSSAWADMAVPGMGAPIPALALPSPAALLTTPAQRRDAWAALRALRRALDSDNTKT